MKFVTEGKRIRVDPHPDAAGRFEIGQTLRLGLPIRAITRLPGRGKDLIEVSGVRA